MISLVVLASALVAPTFAPDVVKRIQDYYPIELARKGVQTSFAAELVFLPDGRVSTCRVVEFVGDAAFADHLCKAFVGLQGTAARDREGNPSYGIMRKVFSWTISAPDVKTLRPLSGSQMRLIVNKLPAGVDHVGLLLALSMSEDGAVVECTRGPAVTDRGKPMEQASEAYLKAACQQAKGVPPLIVRAATGEKVPYVANLSVSFWSKATDLHDPCACHRSEGAEGLVFALNQGSAVRSTASVLSQV
jgi:hypothetical protein